MSPLLTALVLTSSLSIHPATINPTHHTTTTERTTTMASIPYPQRHPSIPPRLGTSRQRIGLSATNPGRVHQANHGYPPLETNPIAKSTTSLIPDERTNRPTGLGG